MSADTSERPFVWTGRIRFADTDASTRIHYSSIFRHFEAAEHEFLRSIGQPYTALSGAGLDYPRVHVDCDFLSPLRFDDLIAIEVTAARVGTTSYTLAFHVTTAGKTAAWGSIAIVCIDRTTGRPHALPASLAEALRRHASEPDGRR
jgi:4-hydroxybenzoyl-CoA thioesterase/acyl-CoA thioester hydrolase